MGAGDRNLPQGYTRRIVETPDGRAGAGSTVGSRVAGNGPGTNLSGGDELRSPVEIKSVWGMQAQRPLVELTVGPTVVQLEIGKALELGALLVQTAMAAKADAFVFDFARTELGADDLAAALMLRKFRAWRLSRGLGTSDGPTGRSSDSTGETITDTVALFAAGRDGR